MQYELIAKRYIKPLMQSCDQTSLDNLAVLLTSLAKAYESEKFNLIMHSNEVSSAEKCQLVLDIVSSVGSTIVNNLIKLLAENGRLSLIPAIADQLTREIGRSKRTFSGRIYSNSVVDQASVETIARDLGTKMGATIALSYVASDFDGVRVEVDDLNVEINFSKNRLNAQMVEHILKAI
ncbi:F0F1 ATP synthase subunit delta [Sulfuricurvum sp.]|uniref:F0F1 ATP synthase subunit delta n=1 Tax=Sulfuricurvum sp. TaxID=2025608 RepID=UPI00260D4AFE|nr:F0F1 ATP synthase subunit delta [Sulfuricurvum sp.]MDD2780121.1 F0F1 ATP synthase subunit delta [Sulfuricurvum sp.]